MDDDPAIHDSESSGDARTRPEVADQGKDVVDTRGETLGLLSDVDDEAIYLEPDPTLTEAVMSKLHWREGSHDEVRVPVERVRRVDDEVVVDVERDDAARSEP